MSKNLVIAIYNHPEYYPPTLSAIEYLSCRYDKVFLVHRNVQGFDWKYPENVELVAVKKLIPVRAAEQASFTDKVSWFITFTRLFFSTVRKCDADTILIYDCLPLLSLRWIYSLIKRPVILWYHNHDVADPKYLKKWSLTWWASKAENWVFPKLDIFSLPALERKVYFPLDKLKGRFCFLPNFPSVKVYERYRLQVKNDGIIKLLYQGSIGELHGLEEIIPLLGQTIKGRELQLVLKGFVSQDYLRKLQLLAEQHGVAGRVIYIGPGGYNGVISNTASCDIGIGIHKKEDIMNQTLGTASNKIYEYAALGLPVLLYNNAHFKSSLEKFSWAFFTDCSAASLVQCLESIISNYELYSHQAVADFKETLNFEHFFLPVIDSLP